MKIENEQSLINCFVCALRRAQDGDLRIADVADIHNHKCRSRTYADLEFTSASGQRWAIEAKYGARGNKHNEVHKLFGDLLRETERGRGNRKGCRIGILLYAGREAFFRERITLIDRCKFIAFGLLVPVDAVFVCGDDGSIERRTWADLHDGPGNGC